MIRFDAEDGKPIVVIDVRDRCSVCLDNDSIIGLSKDIRSIRPVRLAISSLCVTRMIVWPLVLRWCSKVMAAFGTDKDHGSALGLIDFRVATGQEGFGHSLVDGAVERKVTGGPTLLHADFPHVTGQFGRHGFVHPVVHDAG